VIGMPGDIIEIKDKVVYVNKEEFSRDYERYDVAIPSPPLAPRVIEESRLRQNSIDPISLMNWYDPYRVIDDGQNPRKIFNRDWFGPIQVPENKYFVLGDNRDVSEDSRYWGFLDRTDITGSPWLIFWSKGIEFNKLYDSPHIRWNRIFRRAR